MMQPTPPPIVFPPRLEAAIERAVERMLDAYQSEQVRFTDEHKPAQDELRAMYEQAVDVSMSDPDAGIRWFVQQVMNAYGYDEQQGLDAWQRQVELALSRNRRQ